MSVQQRWEKDGRNNRRVSKNQIENSIYFVNCNAPEMELVA